MKIFFIFLVGVEKERFGVFFGFLGTSGGFKKEGWCVERDIFRHTPALDLFFSLFSAFCFSSSLGSGGGLNQSCPRFAEEFVEGRAVEESEDSTPGLFDHDGTAPEETES